MAINITGKEHLDDNSYEGIIITETDDGYQIMVSGASNDKTYFSPESLLDISDGKSDVQKVVEIVRLYLEQNKITELNDNRSARCSNGDYLLCGDGSRYLSIITKEAKRSAILDTVLNKFYCDRDEFLEQNKNIDRIEINMKEYSTYQKRSDCYGEYLELNLFGKDGNLTPEDELFLTKFIFNKLKRASHKAVLENQNFPSDGDELDYINLGYYLTCGDVYISIESENLLPVATKAIVMYERQREIPKHKIKKEGE